WQRKDQSLLQRRREQVVLALTSTRGIPARPPSVPRWVSWRTSPGQRPPYANHDSRFFPRKLVAIKFSCLQRMMVSAAGRRRASDRRTDGRYLLGRTGPQTHGRSI